MHGDVLNCDIFFQKINICIVVKWLKTACWNLKMSFWSFTILKLIQCTFVHVYVKRNRKKCRVGLQNESGTSRTMGSALLTELPRLLDSTPVILEFPMVLGEISPTFYYYFIMAIIACLPFSIKGHTGHQILIIRKRKCIVGSGIKPVTYLTIGDYTTN